MWWCIIIIIIIIIVIAVAVIIINKIYRETFSFLFMLKLCRVSLQSQIAWSA